MKLMFWVLVALVGVIPAMASALIRDEAYALVRDGDVEAIDSAFVKHQAAFNSRLIGPETYLWPYSVFSTTDPRALATVDAWRAAHPASPQAMVAKAAILVHLALIVRGDKFVRQTPSASMTKMHEHYVEALPLLNTALESEQRQLFSAQLLMDIAPFVGDRASEARALKLFRKIGDPKAVFLHDLTQLLPQWGGSAAAMRALCRQKSPPINGMTLAECDAVVTLKLLKADRSDLAAAIETLADLGDHRWVALRASTLAWLDRPREALDLLERHNFRIGWSDGWRITQALGDAKALRRISRHALLYDPYHPRHLAQLAMAQDWLGDSAAALQSADKAMRYGETIPLVRIGRMWVMSKDEDRKWGLLDEFEDAISDTDADPEVMLKVTAALVNPSRFLTHRRDRSPTLNFQCRRLRIYAQNVHSCPRTGTIGANCHPETIRKYFSPALDEARRAGYCRDMRTTTWKQLMEQWLE